jgi:hypothetical protein
MGIGRTSSSLRALLSLSSCATALGPPRHTCTHTQTSLVHPPLPRTYCFSPPVQCKHSETLRSELSRIHVCISGSTAPSSCVPGPARTLRHLSRAGSPAPSRNPSFWNPCLKADVLPRPGWGADHTQTRPPSMGLRCPDEHV